jgi:hypothetical protein
MGRQSSKKIQRDMEKRTQADIRRRKSNERKRAKGYRQIENLSLQVKLSVGSVKNNAR